MMAYGNIYGKFLKRCTKPETAIDGAKQIAKIGSTDNKYVKYAAQKVMNDNLVKVWQDKEDKLTAKIERSKKATSPVPATEIETMNTELKTVTDTRKQIVELYNSIKK